MKKHILLSLLCFGFLTELFASNGQRASELVLSSDKAVIIRETEKVAPGVEVLDREWFKQLAAQLAETKMEESDQCLCIGWLTVIFYKSGKQIFGSSGFLVEG